MSAAELLLEIFSEEIPARMQRRAGEHLARALGDGLKDAGFAFTGLRSFAGPRRLTLVIDDLPLKAPDVREERKGPRVGAPEQALAGFLRGAGLASIDECQITEDKKGSFYVAIIEKPGLSAAAALAQIVPQIMHAFAWPKSMKWGSGDFRWVRPLHGIVCQLNGKTVDLEVAGVRSCAQIHGHRVMGPGPFNVSGFADYQKTLREKGKVVLCAEMRKAMISDQIAALCQQHSLALAQDDALLDEVTGLAEWPVALLGDMDEGFLELPPEVIQLSMAKHQKYFTVKDSKTGKLAPHFIVIANLDAPDGGKAIAQGNARVLTARLADARYFWDTDLSVPLQARYDQLREVVFHQKLGSVYDKMERVAALARALAPIVGADQDMAVQAARLAKADLTSNMVVEFTSLQGVMGRYYALKNGEPAAVADAIRDHYKPQGPSDTVPTKPVSIAVALADKLDTLVGFWAIDEKPTGSKDPYALRRAALGVIRLQRQNQLSICWTDIIRAHIKRFGIEGMTSEEVRSRADDLEFFFLDRLEVQMRDEGERHDLIFAVFNVARFNGTHLQLVSRIKLLGAFLDTPEGASLHAGAKRALNILDVEERKDGAAITGAVDLALFAQDEERKLFAALGKAQEQAKAAIDQERYVEAMAALAPLRPVIDNFFENVTVNAEDENLRMNRLKLLCQIRETMCQIADFDEIAG